MKATAWIGHGLPGEELVRAGVADLSEGRETVEAMAVATAAGRLGAAGVDVPGTDAEMPSHRLYELLGEQRRPDTHSRYNALLRRIVSFARAAEVARGG